MKIIKLLFVSLIIMSMYSFGVNAQYCTAEGGSTTDEWIQSITIGEFTYNSGASNGYDSNTNQTINLVKGQTYNFNLSPGYSGDAFPEYWRIWIDYNQDNDFNDAYELVYDAGQGQEGNQSGSFTVPNNNSIDLGNTRVRIAMKWVGTYNDGTEDLSAPNACGSFDFGEVEDYTANITNQGGSGGDNYCAASGLGSSDEWIQAINIGSYNNNSGQDNGYGNYTSNTFNLSKGNHNITLNPGYSGTQYSEKWRIWIDFNKDNDFTDPNELIFETNDGVEGNVTGNINIPNNVSNGNTRMRIAMKYVGTFDDGSEDYTPPNSCGQFDFGEVEDYTVNIIDGTTGTAPVANFTSNITTGTAPLTVNFTDQSTNNPTTWNWSFDGGSPSTASVQNPTVTYNTPGTYAVTLTASNAAGANTETKTTYITVTQGTLAPIANFSSNVTTGTAPLTVSFFDQTNNAPSAWNWSFPGANPNVSTEQNPIVTYNNPGTYAVTLTATNAAGAGTENKTAYIVVTENIIAPVADFTSSVTSGQSPLNIQFTDLSTNNPSNWAWTFQGGSPASSSLQNPTVLYQTPGTYMVTLTASNSAGTDTETKTGYITVTEPIAAPVAAFIADQTIGAAPLQVHFFDQSSNSPTAWNWTFQGGSPISSNEQNPTITYNTPGTYTVTLTVANSIGSHTQTFEQYITVTELPPLPVASFSASIFEGPAPLVVTFFDQSSGEPVSWQWDMPGGSPASSNEKNPTVTYNNPGTFPVTLTVTNSAGNDTQTQTGYITVDFASGIDDLDTEAVTVLSYPNPTTGLLNLNIQLTDPNQPVLEVYNLVGQKILEEYLPEQLNIQHQINLQDYPTGNYFLKILNNGSEQSTQRIQLVH